MDENCKPMREPFWNEMDDAQKIAALQDAVIWISQDFMALKRLVAQLTQHSHNAAGGIVVPLPPVVTGRLATEDQYRPDYARKLKPEKSGRS